MTFWELEKFPMWQKKIGKEMNYKPNDDAQDEVKRHKHRLLAKCYNQRLSIGYYKVSHRHIHQANREKSSIQGKKFTWSCKIKFKGKC